MVYFNFLIKFDVITNQLLISDEKYQFEVRLILVEVRRGEVVFFMMIVIKMIQIEI
jgi:hypothetical protein